MILYLTQDNPRPAMSPMLYMHPAMSSLIMGSMIVLVIHLALPHLTSHLPELVLNMSPLPGVASIRPPDWHFTAPLVVSVVGRPVAIVIAITRVTGATQGMNLHDAFGLLQLHEAWATFCLQMTSHV